MKISTLFDYNQVQFDKENEVVLMTSFKAPKINLEKERAPLNLSLVLDVSGSMSGKKIEMLKATVTKLIQQLNEKDTVGIVTFTNYISEILSPCSMTASNKSKANAEISKLVGLSATNMSGGMLKGFEQLKISELGKDKVHRILLFTDGQANEGLITKEQFTQMVRTNVADTPMTISCFGYGEDHSEEILKSITDEGKGNFYFIRNTDDIGKAFARELGGLLSCYAQNICIELEMKENTGSFIEVLNNLDVDSKSDRHIKVTFDDVYSEEEKHLLVKLKLNSVTKAVTQRPSSVVKGTVKYNDMTASGKEKKEDISAKIKFVKLEDVQKESTLAVLEQLGLIELSKALEKAKQMADKGDFMGAQGVIGATGAMGALGKTLSLRGSSVGVYMSKCSSDTESLMSSATYTVSASNSISSNARSLKSFRGVDTSSDLYVNSVQKDMEDKFKVTEDDVKDSLKNQLNLADNAVFSSNSLTLGVDTLTASGIQLNQGMQMTLNGVGTLSKPEKSLTKRRTC